ncbi:hypothetical protein BLOT_007879 [Blomia tropicalis]|nr:hypothetical protein BLOT_007879 [Blomia tropicalis]
MIFFAKTCIHLSSSSSVDPVVKYTKSLTNIKQTYILKQPYLNNWTESKTQFNLKTTNGGQKMVNNFDPVQKEEWP